MKLFKYLSIAALAVAAVACSDDDEKVEVKSPGVYFGEDNKTEVMMSPVAGAPTTFEVYVWRTDNKEAQTVAVNYTADAGLFTVPSEVTFAPGAYKATLTVDCDLSQWSIGETKSITFDLGEGSYISDYAYAGQFEAEVTLYYTFKKVGTSMMQDNWCCVIFSDIPNGSGIYEVEVEEAEQLPGLYRIVDPFGASYCASLSAANGINVKPTYDQSKQSDYLEFYAFDMQHVYMLPQEAKGNPWYTRFKFKVGNYAGYLISEGNSFEDVVAGKPDSFAYEDGGIIYFPGKTAFFWGEGLSSDGSTGPFTNVAETALFISMPGVAVMDYSVGLEYIGLMTTESGSKAMIRQHYGDDVKYAKAVLAPGSDVNAIVSAVNDGTLTANWVEDLTTSYLELPVTKGGTYTAVVFTYGHDNEIVQAIGSVTMNIALGAGGPLDGMEEIGLAVYTDGWILFGYGNDPTQFRYQVKCYKDTSAPGVYGVLSPYGKDVFKGQYVSVLGNVDGDAQVMVKFDTSNKSLIKMMPQYSGFNTGDNPKGIGKAMIANLEGMLLELNKEDGVTDADVVNFMTQKGYEFTTFTEDHLMIPTPRISATNVNSGQWVNWVDKQQYTAPSEIWLPGSYSTGVSAMLAASRNEIAPTASKIAQSVIMKDLRIFSGKVDYSKIHPVK